MKHRRDAKNAAERQNTRWVLVGGTPFQVSVVTRMLDACPSEIFAGSRELLRADASKTAGQDTVHVGRRGDFRETHSARPTF